MPQVQRCAVRLSGGAAEPPRRAEGL